MLEAEIVGASKDVLLEIIGNEFNRNRAGSVLGDIKAGAFQAGQSSGLVADIIPVHDLGLMLLAESNETVNSCSDMYCEGGEWDTILI